MIEPCDQDQPMGDEPQVATGNLVGAPPCNPPPPPPGACMAHDVTRDWTCDGDSSIAVSQSKHPVDKSEVSVDDDDDDFDDDEHSNQDSDDDASDASEDVISVLAQAAVEDIMEVVLRQAQSSGSSDANRDNINMNYAISPSEQKLTSMEGSPRTPSALASQPAVSLPKHHPGNKDSPDSEDSEEDETRWMLGENSPPPSQPHPTSRCSPCLAGQMQTSDHSDDDTNEPEFLQEVTHQTETCSNNP